MQFRARMWGNPFRARYTAIVPDVNPESLRAAETETEMETGDWGT